ncbi:MAG: acyl-CoA desaturase [Proteobacteria bacterium]|nr:acyl-CoA desaturase [Pseudomonadota bacterium]
MRKSVWRIDGTDANAVEGRVVWSPFKSLWYSLMYVIALGLGPVFFSWSAFTLFLVSSYVTLLLGHSLGMHRRLIHRSFECCKPFERFLVWLGVLVGMSGPYGIIKIHDLRDWAQREQSCHDFFAHRRSLWVDALWQLHCRFEFTRPPRFRIEPEFARDPWYRLMEYTWPLHQVLLAVVFFWMGGVSWVVWGIAVRVAVSVTSHWIVTYVVHNPGPGRWRVKGAGVQASDLPGWSLLTHGECWHNNHHAFPESANMGLEPGQLDPGYRVLLLLARCRLVSRIGVARRNSQREDLTSQQATELHLNGHRVRVNAVEDVARGRVIYSPANSLWLISMASAAVIGGALTFTWSAAAIYVSSTVTVLLLGHSLGSHRKLIHNSYQCPRWLEYFLVYCGVQVGLAGPLGLLRQHELRDFAQRQKECHPYLRHGSSFWRDAWWQLHCRLQLDNPPTLMLEPRIADDRFYAFLERTWRLQQAVPAVGLYLLGGWGFVFWGVCARITSGVVGHWLIGHFAHNNGGRHFEIAAAAVQGRNIRFTSLLTMGESWHNNHHAFPGSARLGLFAGEWDPGWWLLMVFRKCGLVWDLVLPAALPERAELHAVDDAGAASLPRLRTALSGVKTPRTSWRRVAQLCAADSALVLEGPAATVSSALFRRIAGSTAHFHQNRGLRRLSVAIDNGRILGLPALCVTLARRSRAWRWIAIAVSPAAVAFENLRECFELA